jgi:Tropinone reductase 1
METWEGRSAIVTGASRGIGRATALELAGLRSNLVLLARDREALAVTAAECLRSGAPEPMVLSVDLTDGRAIDAAVAVGLEHLGGRLDLLANVAGSALKRALLLDQDDADWQQSYDLHVMAPVRLQRACFQALRAARGAIVNVGSVSSARATSHGGPYAAAKAALASLTRTTAVEWARYGIRACTIEPGYVATPFNEPMEEAGVADRFLTKVPTRNRIDSAEVARLIVYLGSVENESITGTVVRIDGGMMAKL